MICFRDTVFSSGAKPTASFSVVEPKYDGRSLTASFAIRVFRPSVKILLTWSQPCSLTYDAQVLVGYFLKPRDDSLLCRIGPSHSIVHIWAKCDPLTNDDGCLRLPSSCQDSRLGAAESLTRPFGRGCQLAPQPLPSYLSVWALPALTSAQFHA